MSLWNLTAGDLLTRTASREPTPGGGSVSAIAGALGLGLVCMALEVSARRKGAAPEVSKLLQQAAQQLERLKAHPDADVNAFEGYMAALALPKADEIQKAGRKQALEAAALAATQAPLAAARDLLTALNLAETAATLAHRSIVSDVGAGAHLLTAALQATLLNVDINLSSLQEEARAEALDERQRLAAQAQEKTSQIALMVTTRLAS